MAWHDDLRNPRLVPRCVSPGISTSSPGSPPVEARDNGDDGDACYDSGSIGRPVLPQGDWRVCEALGMYIGDTATAGACITSSRCSS
jgi:hypothetical protein